MPVFKGYPTETSDTTYVEPNFHLEIALLSVLLVLLNLICVNVKLRIWKPLIYPSLTKSPNSVPMVYAVLILALSMWSLAS